MTTWQQWFCIALGMIGAMTLAWRWQRRRANAGIVDVVWALGMGAAALLIAATGAGSLAARLALALMAGVWSLRLAWHLWRRVRAGEDGRYRALREHWQGHQGKFFGLFMFQAGLVMLFCLPFLAAGVSPAQGWPVALALLIWLAALSGEVIADRQLDHFRDNPTHRGLTCRVGLWRYSRHPNYFFEWCHWFAYVALAWGSPLAWLSWLGPVLMYVFLRWISGIPFTEQQALRTRGDDYRDYQRRTPAFFPWFPKS
ncbi:DUF1295 domain-containing protein [Achromobacter sp. ACRQX]|uniref:DUF1295 domain-containing protein n=1 Tax=Achromobacter sp. ACRQX TaxID=2918181 RepID=UPI001EF1901B|nr:DUF1295 domain-containing protein [Achromobacter sp. ACRQX]MCG7324174.1 DUF1295 domain-containing protein [Achromobacter sp. ACRQX]